MYEKEPNRVEPIWSKYDPHGELLPYKANIDLVRVKKKVYRSFLIASPFLVLKAILGMNFKSFCQIVKTFIKQNMVVTSKPKQKVKKLKAGRAMVEIETGVLSVLIL